jgi:hypothetical protein
MLISVSSSAAAQKVVELLKPEMLIRRCQNPWVLQCWCMLLQSTLDALLLPRALDCARARAQTLRSFNFFPGSVVGLQFLGLQPPEHLVETAIFLCSIAGAVAVTTTPASEECMQKVLADFLH